MKCYQYWPTFIIQYHVLLHLHTEKSFVQQTGLQGPLWSGMQYFSKAVILLLIKNKMLTSDAINELVRLPP